jgi:hypothetical protein
MNRLKLLCTIALATGLGIGAASAQEAPDFGQIMGAMMGALSGANQTDESGEPAKPVMPIDFRTLREHLPAELPGLPRTSASGERSSAMGMNVSTAEGVYSDSEGGSITIRLSDMGSMGGFLAMAQFGMAMGEFDRETDTGFERTTTWRGHRAVEEFDTRYRTGKITVMMDALVVDIEGSGVDFAQIEQARDAIAIDDLVAAVKAHKESQAEPPTP